MLAAAAVFQLTATKRRWLARCRAPFTQPDAERVGDPREGARAGLRAGLRCLASSWALMGVLFALGAVSLVWMVLVAALIAAERLPPLASPGRIAATGVLLVRAVSVAVSPNRSPDWSCRGVQRPSRR